MPETVRTQPKIMELMGKQDKKQMKNTHQAIQKAFKNKSRGNGRRP